VLFYSDELALVESVHADDLVSCRSASSKTASSAPFDEGERDSRA